MPHRDDDDEADDEIPTPARARKKPPVLLRLGIAGA